MEIFKNQERCYYELIRIWDRCRIHIYQVDLDIPTVITVLKELGIYRENKKESENMDTI